MHSSMLAEVLSDWGLLELLLGELRRRAKIIRKAGVVTSLQISMNLNIYSYNLWFNHGTATKRRQRVIVCKTT